jgi:hypothetical protein
MRTFRRVKSFGSNLIATGGLSNEAVLVVNGLTAGSITFQVKDPSKNIISVGPITLAISQSLIFPMYTAGYTASTPVQAYELF